MILRRFRPAGNGLLFDNSLNYEGLRLDSRMENGYDKGCTRGAIIFQTSSDTSAPLIPALPLFKLPASYWNLSEKGLLFFPRK